MTEKFRETIAELKEVKRQQLELAQKENRLYNRLFEEIDAAVMQDMRENLTTDLMRD